MFACSSGAAPGQDTLRREERSSVYVEPVTLTEISGLTGLNLNIGAIVSDRDKAKGLQKAADIYGITLNVFVLDKPAARSATAKTLLEQGENYLIVDQMDGEDWKQVSELADQKKIPFKQLAQANQSTTGRFDSGFDAVRGARGDLLQRIPKYDEILPLAFPISPLPDTFFQPSKFPYPSPLVRVARTNESKSASVHAHTSCNMVAQTGNMLHRTSSLDAGRLLMGMEGGNLSLQALPGAIDKPKISAVMTSWVLNVQDGGKKREILVENNGLESSQFVPGIHAPEELEIALQKWVDAGRIRGYRVLDHERVEIRGWEGKDRILRAGMFLVANDGKGSKPDIIQGSDRYGAKTIDFFSTQVFVQQLVELLEENEVAAAWLQTPTGGLLTRGGTTSGNSIGRPLREMLREVSQANAPVKPFVMNVEGGFIVVSPEVPLSDAQLNSPVRRVYLDLRGPLTSDQTIWVGLANDERVTFRRTALDFDQLDTALNALKTMGMISGWEFEGARGRGLFANVVLRDFLGKHRKFMSSLSTWPTDEKLDRPVVRLYVDGMQRLNFGFLTREGWRQEFVEVPLRVPPVPRDISLYSGKSSLE